MNFSIIDTTDNQWLGASFSVDGPPITGKVATLGHDFSFKINKAEEISPAVWRLSNPNYVIVAKEVTP